MAPGLTSPNFNQCHQHKYKYKYKYKHNKDKHDDKDKPSDDKDKTSDDTVKVNAVNCVTYDPYYTDDSETDDEYKIVNTLVHL